MIDKCRRCNKSIDETNYSLDNTSIYKGVVRKYYSCKECYNARKRELYRTKVGKKIADNANKNSISKYPEKNRARQKLRYHVRVGNIKKPSECSSCPSILNIQAHHEDYSKPLDVVWLCTTCHANLHKSYSLKTLNL